MIYTDTNLVDFAIFFRDFILGLLGLSLVIVFHGSCVMRILASYEEQEAKLIAQKRYTSLIIAVYNALSLFAVAHIAGVLIWATILHMSQLIHAPINSILFAGSCYLTLGFVGDILPDGWKSLALFISFFWASLYSVDYFRHGWPN